VTDSSHDVQPTPTVSPQLAVLIVIAVAVLTAELPARLTRLVDLRTQEPIALSTREWLARILPLWPRSDHAVVAVAACAAAALAFVGPFAFIGPSVTDNWFPSYLGDSMSWILIPLAFQLIFAGYLYGVLPFERAAARIAICTLASCIVLFANSIFRDGFRALASTAELAAEMAVITLTFWLRSRTKSIAAGMVVHTVFIAVSWWYAFGRIVNFEI